MKILDWMGEHPLLTFFIVCFFCSMVVSIFGGVPR